ncbi:MAG TPA: diaminopimelate epimerase [Candidatus Eisenbergiella merdipullorum]|uniref:Diaminopimelate epimerase n=1 Tax=Candidatus Eisenbergiella merdipullorum TaxID=2838553 RepID=A0A9D2I826_9FIRM|nr:diaminopimelate epimerase [Candidatus Eisenbergiella merdipullorum]
MDFTKMQGCGNDYIYIDGSAWKVPQEEKPEFVRKMSDRHFGIGGDGVIFINPSQEADFEMEMYNADGSRAQMCGNGIRCVAKFVYDRHMTDKTEITVVSAGSVKRLELYVENGKVERVRVNMGRPVLKASEIPVLSNEEQVLDMPVFLAGRQWQMTCVSMGNPHAVVLADDVESLPLEQIGPKFEDHSMFPERVNTEFIRVIDRHTIQLRVWERGSGETLACGTGCCAAVTACVLNDLTERNVTVRVLGGELQIEWDENTGEIFMTGPAVEVFEGCVEYQK